jgi:hypothetical protein
MPNVIEIMSGDMSQIIDLAKTNLKYVAQVFNVQGYGAKGDGIADDTAAIQAAINAANTAGGGVVHFPPGTYKTTAALIVKPNVIISGAGRHISLIYPSTASMTVFDLTQTTLTRTYNEIYSIGIVAQAASVTGIKSVLASALRFEDLYFAGCLYNFNLDRGSNIQMEGILVEGTTTYAAGKSLFQDTTKADYIYDLQITDYQIRNVGNGVQDPSMTFNRCVGSVLNGYHANDLSTGGTGSTQASGILYSGDCQGCKIAESIIVKPQSYGVKYISEGSPAKYPIAMTITDVDIDQSQGVGIQIDAGFWYTITGGNLTDILGTHGIIIGSNNTTVEGVKIIHCISQGIQVNANVNHFIIEGNHIEQCSTAILVSAGTSDNYIIRDNNLSVSNTNKIVDNGTGINKLIGGNLGIDNSYKNEYADTVVLTLTGGATTESKTITIPAGLFSAKPKTGFLMGQDNVTYQTLGFYDYNNAANSATAAVFLIAKNDGTTLAAGSYRFSVLLKG